MLTATCHCGAVRLELKRRPRSVTSCNCSICRRYGTLWAYYPGQEVRIVGSRQTTAYCWGDRALRFLRCRHCGCVTHWQASSARGRGRMGVNARNFPPQVLAGLRVRHLDGAQTWKYL